MDKIEELLTRGVTNVVPSKEELEKELRSGKKLRIYQGFDPTSPQLHIGHLVGLRKLKQWQNLGHEVIFLIGDFTGMIGDPTGKDKTRVPLTKEQVAENAKTYKEQASKVLNFEGDNPVIIKFNSEWLGKMSAIDLIMLASNLTIQQVIERDMFQKRLKSNADVAVSEFLYPLMQGYDSVAMDIDVEVGGNDQLFNMMTGRDLMHKLKRKNKFVLTTPLLTDALGNKIGKTEGNVIALTDKSEEIFGKIMAFPDDVIVKSFEYLTDLPMDEINKIEKEIKDGENPLTFKKQLAFEIVKELNSEKDAKEAQDYFEKTVQNKELPPSLPTISFSRTFISTTSVTQGTVAADLASSNSEARRLIEQGGLRINDQVVKNPNDVMSDYIKNDEATIQKGPRKVKKIKVTS